MASSRCRGTIGVAEDLNQTRTHGILHVANLELQSALFSLEMGLKKEMTLSAGVTDMGCRHVQFPVFVQK